MRSPEEVKAEIVRQWLAKAEQDLGAVEALLETKPLLLYPACFHAQQAVEKCLKAFLTWRQIEFPKTHSIRELLDLVEHADPGLASELLGADALTPYGVDIRYPGDAPEPERNDAHEARELARKVHDAVIHRMGEIL